MRKGFSIFLIVSLILLFAGWANALDLFGGRLHEVKGSIQQTLNYRTHQDYRHVKFSSFRTTLRVEGLLDIVTEPCWNLKLYGLLNYWYDNGVNIDASLERAIDYESHAYGIRNFKRPNEQEEIMKEMYFEYVYSDLFTARLGKQMVSWGETAESRVADVINPLDYNNFIAFPDWEDYKIGLWMGRFFFTPRNMWQDISFELILIPPDFQYNRLSPAGSGQYFGFAQGMTQPLPFGTFRWPEYNARNYNQMRHDTPTNDADNIEVGLRIRGLTLGADWTLSTFYTRLDSPIINGQEGYLMAQQMVQNEMKKQFPFLPFPRRGVHDVYIYPHYLSSAITFSKPWDWAKSVIRGEIVLNSNREYNWISSDYRTLKTVSRELLTSAITWDRKNMVPWLSYWNKSRSVGTSITWYHYKLFGHDHGLQWEAGRHGVNQSSWDKITLSIDTGFYHDTIIPVFNFSYDWNGPTVISGAIRFAPGDHWRWMVVYQQINETKARVPDNDGVTKLRDIGKYQNQVIFSMRYEF